MFRRSVTLLAAVLVAASAPQNVVGAPQSAADLLDVPKLLDDLSHTDTAVRKNATDKLTHIGEPARPELIKAARSDDPERRARAADILRSLPWFTANDPAPIRTLLERYGIADDRMRMNLLWQINEGGGDDGADVLLRLLTEEPSDAVRWFIAALLTNERSVATQKKVLALDPASDDAAALVLVGATLLDRDRQQALKLLSRAIEAEESRPGADIGLLAIAFDALTDDALSRGDVETAAAVLRRQVPRDGRQNLAYRRAFGQREPHALARLMALHTYFGPLRGFEADLRRWGDGNAPAPSIQESFALLLSRFGPAPPLPWQALDMSAEQHLAAGAFLLHNKFYHLAEAELRQALSAPTRANALLVEANALFALGESTAARGDDDACADFLERGMQVKQANRMSFGETSRRQDDDVMAEIHWRRARAASVRGDTAAVDKYVRNLLQLTPSHSDQTIEIIRWLKESSHGAEGKRLFDKVYIQTRARLDASPDDERPGMQNNLAWLCARAGERIEEAVELAREAVAAQPDSAAFLDTLAESCFLTGRAEEAVKYELRALELQPGDRFMTEQLQRFRAGLK